MPEGDARVLGFPNAASPSYIDKWKGRIIIFSRLQTEVGESVGLKIDVQSVK